MENIYSSKPSVGPLEAQAVSDAVLSGWVAQGPVIGQFEQAFADAHRNRHGVSCSSGMSALELAILSLRLPPFTEIIVPNLTMIAVLNAVERLDYRPKFAEVSGVVGNVTVDSIKECITDRTSAVIVVHNYGEVVEDMAEIRNLCHHHGLKLIEDCAEAHYADVARYGDVNTFSFYANKIITTGEGGMVLTNYDVYQKRMQLLRNHYFGPQRFIHEEPGLSCRMSNLSAALGLCQHNRRDEFIQRRKAIKAMYLEGFANLPIEYPTSPNSANWLMPIQGGNIDGLIHHLHEKKIETRRYFYPFHKQPLTWGSYSGYAYSEKLYENGLCLPIYPSLTDDEVGRVVDAVKGFYANV
jgi:perosamine synthetase